MAEFKQTFLFYDEDNSGSVNVNELVSKMKPLGQEIQKSKLEDMLIMMKNIDHDRITFPEFINLMSSTIKDDDTEEELELAYKEIVKKGLDQPIEKTTFRRVFNNLGETVTDEELTRVLEVFDVDVSSQNQVDFEEFLRCMLK